jgi:hypothetical protein
VNALRKCDDDGATHNHTDPAQPTWEAPVLACDAPGRSDRTASAGLSRAQEALGEESRGPRWTCPAAMLGASDAQALVDALEAFRAAHAPAGGVVGVWLDPEELADDGLYSAWLQRLAAAVPAGCRFVVLEEVGRPAFEALASRA